MKFIFDFQKSDPGPPVAASGFIKIIIFFSFFPINVLNKLTFFYMTFIIEMDLLAEIMGGAVKPGTYDGDDDDDDDDDDDLEENSGIDIYTLHTCYAFITYNNINMFVWLFREWRR